MRSKLRLLVSAGLGALALLTSAGIASAHPLGNYTVNRSVGVRIASSGITLRYIIDMAEIPAFSELQRIDRNSDGLTDPAEVSSYAEAACAAVQSQVQLSIDGSAVALQPRADPELSFPAGAGGLSTLRLVCVLGAPMPKTSASFALSVVDRTDDGHVGWHEVTVSQGPGMVIKASDVPNVSPSAELTAYPVDVLQTPPDVRSGTARLHRVSGGSAAPAHDAPGALVQRPTANDPLAALVGGELTPAAAIGALLLALLLGAGHAVSPGHGKTLIAAYLIGSRGSVRHAATLGLTVAITHTAGVFLLGAVTLLIGQFFVPERVIEWLSIASGVLVALLGAGLVIRAIRGAGRARAHRHPHPDSTRISTRIRTRTRCARRATRPRPAPQERDRAGAGRRDGAERIGPDRLPRGHHDGAAPLWPPADRRLWRGNGGRARRPGGGNHRRARLGGRSERPGLASVGAAGRAEPSPGVRPGRPCGGAERLDRRAGQVRLKRRAGP